LGWGLQPVVVMLILAVKSAVLGTQPFTCAMIMIIILIQDAIGRALIWSSGLRIIVKIILVGDIFKARFGTLRIIQTQYRRVNVRYC
jgi:hypothetical protein